MGKKKMVNNCITGVIFAGLGIFFLILTIAVPIASMINDHKIGDLCQSWGAETLRPGEQMYCKPKADDLSETWVGEYEEAGAGYVNVYKINNPSMNTVTRDGAVISGSHSLYNKFKHYNFSVAHTGSVSISVVCSSASTTPLRVYVMNKQDYINSFDKDTGIFTYTLAPNPKTYTCDEASGTHTYTLSGSPYYYVLFSSVGSTATFDFEITPSYSVYDLSSYSSQKCDSNRCEYEDMSSTEYIFVDYPSSSTGPKWVSAFIHNKDIDVSKALILGLVLGIITIVCFAVAAVFLVKQLKKMGKIGKKAMKKAEKNAENNAVQMQAATPAAQPYPAQAYPAQAYPADPNAQPYPGQPYPGQPM